MACRPSRSNRAIAIFLASLLLPYPLLVGKTPKPDVIPVQDDEARYSNEVTRLIDGYLGDVRPDSPVHLDLAWRVASVSPDHYVLNVSYAAGPPLSFSRSVDVTLYPGTMTASGPRSSSLLSFIWTTPGRRAGDTVAIAGDPSLPISGRVVSGGNVETPQGLQETFIIDAGIVNFSGYRFPLIAGFDADVGLHLSLDFNIDGVFLQAGFIYSTGNFRLVSTTIDLGPRNLGVEILLALAQNVCGITAGGVAFVFGILLYRRWRSEYKLRVEHELRDREREKTLERRRRERFDRK